MLHTSKLTSKYQATVPTPVREVLALASGDLIGFEITDGEVRVRKASALDVAFAQALEGTLTEWASPEDDQAFTSL